MEKIPINIHLLSVGDTVFDLETNRALSVHEIAANGIRAHWLDESGAWQLDYFPAEKLAANRG